MSKFFKKDKKDGALISTDRRRLSVGEPAAAEEHYDGVAAAKALSKPENLRGLIKFLESKSILEAAEDNSGETESKPIKARRGSFTKASQTDKTQDSFDEKKQVSEGDSADNKKLKQMGVGIACKKGLKPEAPNQDSYVFCHQEGDDGFELYGVFDGHGIFGHDVSNFCREVLPKLFLSDKQRDTNVKAAFADAFAKTQKLLEEDKQIDCRTSGTTATLAYKKVGSDELHVAHCGDSRAMLVYESKGKAHGLELTPDHKPNLPGERRRIEEGGGAVIFDGFYNHRVFKKGTVYPGLNMSRAMGDVIGHREAGITQMPDVKTVNMKGKHEFLALLVCSDGVWEFIDCNEAAKLVLSSRDQAGKIDPAHAVEMLSKESWNRWMEDTGGEICDDITALIQVL